MITRIVLFIMWLAAWVLLSWPMEPQDLIIGIVVSLFVVFMTEELFSKKPALFKRPARYLWFIYYLIVFLWECIKANLDVAYRVIHPDLPIRPGTIKVKTTLKSDVGLTFLANSITLTPGTTTVDIDKERGYIYVHWLHVSEGYDKGKMKLASVGKFENILKRIYE